MTYRYMYMHVHVRYIVWNLIHSRALVTDVMALSQFMWREIGSVSLICRMGVLQWTMLLEIKPR